MRATERRATRFEVAEPEGRVVFWLWALTVVLPVVVVGIALGGMLLGYDKGTVDAPQPVPLLVFALVILGVCAIALPLGLWFQRSLRRLAVEFDGHELNIRAGWYRLRVATGEVDVARARVVNLDEHREYRPLFKSNAVALPGYRVGHFRLCNWRRRAFALLTTRDRIAMLPLRDGRTVLLSLRQPQRLIEALREAAG